MKTIMFRFFVLGLMLISVLNIRAYDFEVDGIFYTIISTGDLTCKVDGAKSSDVLTIPKEVNYLGREFTVVAIENINGCKDVKEVKLPSTVTSIYSYAFKSCKNLISINFEQVKAIGYYAFSDCISLKSIIISEGCDIRPNAFENCIGLKTVIFNAEKVPMDCFLNCSALELISFSDNLRIIDVRAFMNCGSLQYIKLPESVQKIEGDCFYGCESLLSLTIPSKVVFDKYGPYESFLEGCYGLETIEWNAPVIPRNAFKGCINLTNLVIGENVESINLGSYNAYYEDYDITFGDCCIKNLSFLDGQEIIFLSSRGTPWQVDKYTSKDYYGYYAELTLPFFENIEELYCNRKIIGYRTKDTYSKVRKLTLGNKIYDWNDIGGNLNWGNLEYLRSENLTPPIIPDRFTTDQYINMQVEVPMQSLEVYKNTEVWKNFWNISGVKIKNVDEIVLSNVNIDLHVGETFQLNVTLIPEDNQDETIDWRSTNENIATVSNDGLVTGVSVGETEITASCGDVSATCKVKVLAEDGVDNILMDVDSLFSIYSIEGISLKKECSLEELNHLPKGIYIIVSDNKRFKISI